MPRTQIEPHKGDKRYVRRKKGKFTKSQDEVGRSLAADRRKRAKTKVKAAKVIAAIARDCRDNWQSTMAEQPNIPHVKNVDLVPEAKSHGGAPGFQSRLTFVNICSEPRIASGGFASFTACMISWNQVNRAVFVS